MHRNMQRLSTETFDLLIIGGGIHGACAAWEAASRGLSTALIEKEDFAWATSANSLKIIHGGFRYLQHGDLKRMRQSIVERRILMRTAPHLIHPLPVVIPIYGHGIKGREVFGLALKINDLVGYDRNQIDDPQKHIPQGKLLSREECLEVIPGIGSKGLTGGIIFYDAQVYNSERLVIAYLRTAAREGAAIANYVEAAGFLQNGSRITGVRAIDRLSGDEIEVRARMVVNTGGPWLYAIDGLLKGQGGQPPVIQAKAVNLVTRPLFKDYAVGLMGSNNMEDREALIKKGSSFLFIAPWRDRSLVGTLYRAFGDSPDNFQVTRKDVEDLIEAVNQAYPPAKLRPEDVTFVHGGLLPANHADMTNGTVNLRKHLEIHDHRQQGISGLLSVEGVKYTTARRVAVQVINLVFKKLGIKDQPSISDRTRLYGGEIERFDDYLKGVIQEQPCGLDAEAVERLVKNYGSAYSEVLRYAQGKGRQAGEIPGDLAVMKAEAIYAVREEMAHKLGDVIFRRTETGSAGYPGEPAINTFASVMRQELGWDQKKEQQEIDEVGKIFNRANGSAGWQA